MLIRTFRSYSSAVAACVVALLLSFALCVPSAFAEVRKADIIMGETVEERDLTIGQCPSIDALYALVMKEDGTILFERNAYDATQIASITKIMTAIVALDSMPLNTEITVSETAAAIGESSASLMAGDKLTLEDALKALLVSSGNDAARAIAETVGGQMLKSQGKDASDGNACNQAFVDAMNDKAVELKLFDTVFRNPHGLDDGEYAGDQHSCASDVAIEARYAMEKQVFRDTVKLESASFEVTRDGQKATIDLESTDTLLGTYEGACGIKTGFTDLAGASFAGASNRGGQDVYAIVIHSSDESQRFLDAEALMDWAYEHSIDYSLIHSNKSTTNEKTGEQVPVVAEVAHTDWTNKTVMATIADPEQTVAIFDLDGNVSQSFDFAEVKGSINPGDKLGTISFKQHNDTIVTVDMIATQAVPAPNFIEGIGIWWDRLFRSFSGDDGVAESIVYNDTPLVNDKSSSTAS